MGDWRVFPRENRLQRNETTVRIQHLSMQVLLYLAAQPRLVATYDEMLETLWPGRFTGEEAIHRRIADLRRHLDDNARAPAYIETIPKVGYRLVQDVVAVSKQSVVNLRRHGGTTNGSLPTWDPVPHRVE
jgi:DNA-binding winged helix-turn-helix (wHTH) protein